MKRTCLLLLLIPVHLIAQTANNNNHSNSISLLGETSGMFSGGNNTSMATAGIQYYKKGKKYFAHTFTAGYSNYTSATNRQLISISGDTARGRNIRENINLGVLGFGMETERQFYRKLYFLAGVDVRAGYGTGTADTTINAQYIILQPYPGGGLLQETMAYGPNTVYSGPESMLYIGVTPYFGLKVAFKRLSIGTSFMKYVNYESISARGGHTYGSVSFDMSNITQRVFVSYKL